MKDSDTFIFFGEKTDITRKGLKDFVKLLLKTVNHDNEEIQKK